MAVTLLRQKQIDHRLVVVISNTGGYRGHEAVLQEYVINEDGSRRLNTEATYGGDHHAIREFNNYIAELEAIRELDNNIIDMFDKLGGAA